MIPTLRPKQEKVAINDAMSLEAARGHGTVRGEATVADLNIPLLSIVTTTC